LGPKAVWKKLNLRGLLGACEFRVKLMRGDDVGREGAMFDPPFKGHVRYFG